MTEDQDLKKIRNALQTEVSELDMRRWKSAVSRQRSIQKPPVTKQWMQWAVAASVGFIIGAATFSHPFKSLASQPTELSLREDATFEHVYVNDR